MTMTLPMTDAEDPRGANGYDDWGVARRIHALAVYALSGDGEARAVACGEDAEMVRRPRTRRAARPESPA